MATINLTTELLLMGAGECNTELLQWLSRSFGDNKNSDLFHPETNKKTVITKP